jgi:hypothetical protein
MKRTFNQDLKKTLLNEIQPIIQRKAVVDNNILELLHDYIEDYKNETFNAVRFSAAPNPKYNHIVAIRSNGTEEAVSYKKLIDYISSGEYHKKPPKSILTKVCRNAVNQDIRNEFPPKVGFEVDHCGDYEFKDIFEHYIQLMDSVGITVDDLVRSITSNEKGIRVFSDEIYEQIFRNEHNRLAKLQYLSVDEHKAKTHKH